MNLSEYNDRMGPRNVFVSVCRCELLRDIHPNYSTYNPMTHKRRRVSSRHLYTLNICSGNSAFIYIIYVYRPADRKVDLAHCDYQICRRCYIYVVVYKQHVHFFLNIMKLKWDVGRTKLFNVVHSYNFTRIYARRERVREKYFERERVLFCSLSLSMNMWTMFYTLLLFNKKKSNSLWGMHMNETNIVN